MSREQTGNVADKARAQLLSGPIAPTLLRLALPTLVVMVVQTSVSVVQTIFVSHLGTAALAGLTLVFPVLMLMQMMSNGGIGSGVTSAVARAWGAGRQADADALALHALVLGVVLGLAFTAFEFLAGPALYSALGGRGEALAEASAFGHTVFAGAVLIWIVSLVAAALRGSGNVRVPALVSFASLIIILPLSYLFIFGAGVVPALGVAGAGAAVLAFYAVAAVVLIAYLRSGRAAIALRFDPGQLRWRMFQDVLRVGGLSSVGALQTNLTAVIATAAVGAFGADAIAGYGVASRLDYVLLPLLLGLGTAVITLVGTNLGAGQVARARKIAWTGAWMAALFCQAIGVLFALMPHAWLGIFSDDPGVLEAGTLYLHWVAPFYGFYGLGMALYFAGQGAGRVFWHVLAGTARLLLAGVGGWFVVAGLGGSMTTLFLTIALAAVVFAGLNVAAKLLASWEGDPAQPGRDGSLLAATPARSGSGD